jgi:hypothetical protein
MARGKKSHGIILQARAEKRLNAEPREARSN